MRWLISCWWNTDVCVLVCLYVPSLPPHICLTRRARIARLLFANFDSYLPCVTLLWPTCFNQSTPLPPNRPLCSNIHAIHFTRRAPSLKSAKTNPICYIRLSEWQFASVRFSVFWPTSLSIYLLLQCCAAALWALRWMVGGWVWLCSLARNCCCTLLLLLLLQCC